MPQVLRIFVSSPSDVSREREVAAQVIERLSQDFARFVTLDLYLWQNEALSAARHFQDDIEPPSTFDIVIIILRGRLGTPLPERTARREYRGIDGRVPVTGTEWEYEDALRAARENGAPDLLVYRSRENVQVDSWDTGRREEQLNQLASLDKFWQRHFADKGLFLGAYTQFSDLPSFEASLDAHLRRLIERRIGAGAGSPVLWTRPPFRGLAAYEFEDAPIFFGQDDALLHAMIQLADGASAGAAFLLVLGASGSGKSSLVRAGVLPKLMAPRRIPGLAFLRRVIFRPSDTAENETLLHALARTIVASDSPDTGLPELLGSGQGVDDFARHLASEDPAYAVSLALSRVGEEAVRAGRIHEFEAPRMVLVVDQLEELFTIERCTADERRRFVEIISALARSGLVWVIATMRKDFWHRADETPELVKLSEGDGRLELLPPTPAQYSLMIRRPAEAAGVGFQSEDDQDKGGRRGIALNDAIAEDVAREPGALPLLSYLLDQIYQSDVIEAAGAVLTFATYRRLGRLEGAIANRAEQVLTALPPEDQAALPSLLFSLVRLEPGDGSAERAVAKRVPLSHFPEGSAKRRLIEAFSSPDARLLILDSLHKGHPTVRLAHEALITKWGRAKAFIEQSASLLRIRRQVELRYANWSSRTPGADPATQTGWSARQLFKPIERTPGLLTDLDLQEAERLLAMRGDELEEPLKAYISTSRREEDRARSRTQKIALTVASVTSVLALAAASLGGVALVRWQQSLAAQSRFLAASAETQIRQSNMDDALSILLEALPGAGHPRPLVPEALADLKNVVASDPQSAVLAGHEGPVGSAVFSPDGRRIVTAGADATARIWDAATGIEIQRIHAPSALTSAAFSPDGRLIVTAGVDGAARLWDWASGREIVQPLLSAKRLNRVVFAPYDANMIATACADGAAAIWDIKSRTARVLGAPSSSAMESVSFSSDGARLVSASDSGQVRIWDVHSGGQLQGLDVPAPVFAAAFSPDSAQVLTASGDRKGRVWTLSDPSHPLELNGHLDVVRSIAFSADGSRIVTAGSDWTIRFWDPVSGQEISQMKGHRDSVQSAAFSPDGAALVSASSDGTARLWDVPRGKQLRVYRDAPHPVRSVSFSSDGGSLAWASEDDKARVRPTSGGPALVFDDANTGSWMNDAEFSPDRTLLATASDASTVKLWRSNAPQAPVQSLGSGGTGHQDVVESVAFSPDGSRVLTSSRDQTALIWNWRTASPVQVLAGHTESLANAVYSPNGLLVATSSLDGTARLWLAASGRQIAVLRGHGDKLFSVSFSHDNERVVTASADHTARIWNVKQGSALATLWGHTAAVEAAAFSPDGARVATGSDDMTIRIWDAKSAEPLAILYGHGGPIYGLAYSPDGRMIATGSGDNTVRLWDVTPTALAQQPLVNMAAAEPAQLIEWAQAARFEALPDVIRVQLGLRPQAVFARGSAAALPCDELAADPNDPWRRSSGVSVERLARVQTVRSAIRACSDTAGSNQDRARFAYQRGRALEMTGDLAQARRAYELALAGGYPTAAEGLARMLLRSQPGASETARAIQLLQQAWTRGVKSAAFELGGLYEAGVRAADGRQLVAPDPSKSADWFDRASRAGEPDAVARQAGLEEARAVSADASATQDKALLAALLKYRSAAELAQRQAWPDELWRAWRYRRASLARILAKRMGVRALAGALGS